MLSRRGFLATAAAKPISAAGIRRELFRRSPRVGVAAMAYAWYTRPWGGEMLSIEHWMSRSDTVDVAYYSYSPDHGKTWSKPVERKTGEKLPQGMLRRHPRGGWVDPVKGWFIELWNEGVLATDDPLEGLRQWNVYYKVSKDGARTFGPARPLVHVGQQFDAAHPMPGIWIGKNSVMLGDHGSVPVARKDGTVLLPVELTLIDKLGRLYNPGGGYTYGESAVVIGRWNGDVLEWELSDRVQGDPAKSTRGMLEPTLGWLTGGRLLMVLRGSNDRKPHLPSRRWAARSRDGGRTWSKPEPWTYTDGTPFFSPSSCSQLLRHSNGRLFWLGNISPANASGNRPRYPFVVGQVQLDSGLLIRDSVRTVDDKRPEDDPLLTLSNFYAREDRQTREIVVHMTRMFALSSGWRGDAMLYRIPV